MNNEFIGNFPKEMPSDDQMLETVSYWPPCRGAKGNRQIDIRQVVVC